MIDVNGHEFSAITDPIYIDGKRVLRVYANGKQVYPGIDHIDAKSPGALFKLNQDIISWYSEKPVNECGLYAHIDNGISAVHRIAFVVESSGHGYYNVAIYVSCRNYMYEGVVRSVSYVAKDGVIIADGLTHPELGTMPLIIVPFDDGRCYYHSESRPFTLMAHDHTMLTDYAVQAFTGENVFKTTLEAAHYVLS